MLKLTGVAEAWETADFTQTFKQAVQALDADELFLQQALAHSSYVSDSKRDVVILDSAATPEQIRVKAGVFYAGIIAGSCCADDPTPICEENEYCELEFRIDRQTAVTDIRLLSAVG